MFSVSFTYWDLKTAFFCLFWVANKFFVSKIENYFWKQKIKRKQKSPNISLLFIFGLCKTCILVSSVIIGQKCPFNTFPFISLFVSLPISLYQYFTLHLLSLYQYQTHFHSLYHYQTHFQKKKKKKKKKMKKSSNVQWRIKQLFCKVQ